MPEKLKRVFLYAVSLWLIGFIWGTVVFMTPQLKNVPTTGIFSEYPLITFPLLIVFIILLLRWSKKHLVEVSDKKTEAIKFGLTIFVVNFVLDVVIYRFVFSNETYFFYLSIWFSYIVMVGIPYDVARKLSKDL